MPVSYPVSWPSYFDIVSQNLQIDRPIVRGGSRGGSQDVVQVGRSIWRAQITVAPLETDVALEAQAFVESLRDGIGTLLFAPYPFRPRAYPGSGWTGINRHSGSAFDGTCNVTAASGNAVTLGILPSTYIVRPGDLVSWPYGVTRTLHRVVNGGTASGGVVTVDVEPEIPPGVSYPQTARIENVTAIWSLAEPVSFTITGASTNGITFSLAQRLRIS
jgi:hypothetical protein